MILNPAESHKILVIPTPGGILKVMDMQRRGRFLPLVEPHDPQPS